MKTITAVLIGAGGRGATAYAPYAIEHPNELKIVAVAEPDVERRGKFMKQHGLPMEQCYESWEELVDKPKLADVVMICTQDQMHYAPAVAFMRKGYDLLLEKPMSNSEIECAQLALYAKQYGRKVAVCHVLRYTQFFRRIKKLIKDDAIGRIISIQHNENVGYWHQALSYVRGPWRRKELASPMILAKSCHDMDILLWLTESDCSKVASFGSLSFFNSQNAPVGSTNNCLEGCEVEAECPWYAPRYYMNNPKFLEWVTGVGDEADYNVKLNALRLSSHGRCVFRCDNDVVDHQVAILNFKDGITATFNMCAFTKTCSRTLKIMGTKGELRGDMDKGVIEIGDFLTEGVETYSLKQDEDGHYGGDVSFMHDFVRFMQPDYEGELNSSAGISLQSHLMAFAIEKSRTEGGIVDVEEYIEGIVREATEKINDREME